MPAPDDVETFNVEFHWNDRTVMFKESRGRILTKKTTVPMVVVKGVMQEILRVECAMEGQSARPSGPGTGGLIVPPPGSGLKLPGTPE